METPDVVVHGSLVSKRNLKLKFIDNKRLHNNKLQDKKIASISNRMIKRTMDIGMGLVGITTLIPITTFVYLGNIINKDKGAVFYAQDRIGKDGKIFKMYKYRTMIENADEVLNEMLEKDEKVKEEYTVYKKLKKDIRITKMGDFLRRTSIDELPQLINVLKGEMSLIGPRPYLPKEKKDMGSYYKHIIKEKPGITGYWQVSRKK